MILSLFRTTNKYNGSELSKNLYWDFIWGCQVIFLKLCMTWNKSCAITMQQCCGDLRDAGNCRIEEKYFPRKFTLKQIFHWISWQTNVQYQENEKMSKSKNYLINPSIKCKDANLHLVDTRVKCQDYVWKLFSFNKTYVQKESKKERRK